MTPTVILAARRSAVAPRGGALSALHPHELAAPVITQVLADAGLKAQEVGELILANAIGEGGNPARLAVLEAGLPQSIAGLTIDRQCAGGLDAILLAEAMVRSGQHEAVIAGGAESYSRRPQRLRRFADGRSPFPYDQAPFTPWPERDPDMAEAADALAVRLKVSQASQDAWAIDSHQKARACPPDLRLAELVQINSLSADAFTRELTLRHCEKAPVVHGAITAANMAVAADAAAFVLVVSGDMAKRLGNSGVEIAAGRTLGDAPDCPGLAPVPAIAEVLQSADVSPNDLTSAEIMEAFAVQAIACQQAVGLPPAIVNRFGGALARGHPIGASGAILAVSLFHQLKREGGTGLGAIAAAGGLGSAVLLRM